MELKCFNPSVFRLFPNDSGSLGHSFSEKLRYAYRLLGDYRIYLLKDGETTLGHAVMQRGGISRYPFVKKGGWLLGPYFIEPQHRGHGYAKTLLSLVWQDVAPSSNAVNACILSDNPASLKTVSALGWKRIGYLDARSAFKKKLVECVTPCEVWRLDKE